MNIGNLFTSIGSSYSIPINANIFLPLLIWSIFWKGWALWRAGRNNQLPWFIIILVLNTLGILEIIYLLAFQTKNKK